MKKLIGVLVSKIIFITFLMISNASFSSQCTGNFVNPITDICWDCLFPITIGASPVVVGESPDTPNPISPICACKDTGVPRVGITLGYWEPFALVDVTRKPFCMVNLGGIELDISTQGLGGSQMPSEDGRGAFYYVHWYKYPVMYWLNIISSVGCLEPDGFDIMFPSELVPTWNDSELAFITNPESLLFSHPYVRATCAVDAASAIFATAIDAMFWCQGAQGSTYPLNGFVTNQTSPISAAILLAERTNFLLHRGGAILDSDGDDPIAPSTKTCFTHYSSMASKSRYRYQMTNTIPDAESCHPFGHSSITWETGHTVPGDGDNFGFMIWRKRNCCFL